MVSCDVHMLLKEGNSYVKNGMKLVRSNVILPRGYVEEKNNSWKSNGLWHEKDEEGTIIYYEQGKLKNEAKRNAKKKKSQLTEVMSEILENANRPIDLDDDVDELVALKAEYVDKFGKKPHYLWKKDKLTEKLNEK